MKLLRLNIIVLILLAVSGVLLWMALPQLLESVAQKQLQSRGLNNVDISISSLSSKQLVVDGIRLSAPDNSWHIDVANIAASFDWRELVNGKVQTISIENLAIEHTPLKLKSKLKDGFILQPLLLTLNQSWKERIPFSKLDVEQLTLRSTQTTPPIEMTARAQVHKQINLLMAEVDFLSSSSQSRSVQLDWQEREGLSIELKPVSQADVAPAFLRIKPVNDDQLVGEFKLDMDGLKHWMSPLTAAASQFTGQFAGQFTGSGIFEAGLNVKELADGNSELVLLGTGRDFQILDFSVDDAQVSINGLLKQADQAFEFTLDGENYLQLNALTVKDIQTEKLRVEPKGSIQFNDGKITAKLESETQILLYDFQQGSFSIQGAVMNWPGEIKFDDNNINVVIAKGGRIIVNEAQAKKFQIAASTTDIEASIHKTPNGFNVELSSSLTNSGQVVFAGITTEEAKAQLAGDLRVNDDQFSFRFAENSSVGANALSAKNWSVDKVVSTLAGTIESSQGFIHWRDANLKLTLEDISVLDYTAADGRFDWTGALKITPDETFIELSSDSAIAINKIDSDVLSVGRVASPLTGSINSSNDFVALTLAPDRTVTADKIKVAGIDINQAKLRPDQQDILTLKNTDDSWSISSNNWRANVTPFAWQQYPITPETMSVNFDVTGNKNNAWSARSRVTTEGVTTQLDEREITLLDIASDINTNGKSATANTEFSMIPDIGRIHSALDYQIAEKKGEITFDTASIDLGERQLAVSDFWQPWPYEFDLVAGIINVDGQVQWDSSGEKTNTQIETNLSIEQGGGFFREILFSGLSADLPLNVHPSINTLHSAKVNIDQIDFGLPISNARATVSLHESNDGPLPGLMIGEVSAGFLGGEIKSDKVQLDFNRDQYHFMMNVESLDIEEMMRLQEFEGLAASGKINGRIPVDVRADGVYIEQGEVYALNPGGRINYVPEGGTESIEDAAPGTEIVFQALRDFRYDVMTADTFYSPDGNLQLQMHLEGTSPELKTSRLVHVNINLEQNVLSLLRSLRLVDGLNEKLDERVRERYEKIRQ